MGVGGLGRGRTRMHGSMTRHSRSSAEMFDGKVPQKHEEIFLQGVDKGAVHLCKCNHMEFVCEVQL